jgi:outer membrane receptor for monomeric catechols
VPDSWGDSTNTFNSINLNHNWVLGGSKLNEFIFQYADFANYILARTGDPRQTFANGVSIGYNVNTPQTTIQHKFQFRDDFSWHVTGRGGLGHDLKTGINFINEPKLYVTFNSGSSDYAYTHVDNNINGPISGVTRNKDGAAANLPMKQWGMYFQDDWRLTSRLTLNMGPVRPRHGVRHQPEGRDEFRQAAGGRPGRNVQRRDRLPGMGTLVA